MFKQLKTILVLLALFLLILPVQAQDDLQQITADDGSFSFSLPDDWVTLAIGGAFVAGTSQGAIQSMDRSEPVPDGEALIYVLGPNFFVELYDIPPDEALDVVLQTLLDEMAGDESVPEFDEIQYVDLPDGRSLVGVEATDTSPLDGAMAILNSEGGGFLGALVVTPAGEVDEYEDIYFEMLLSLHGGPPTATGPLPEASPTPIPGLAASGPLHVVAADSSFSFDLPADWITVDNSSIIIAATSQAALDSLNSPDPVPAGEAVLVVMGPTFFAGQFGIAPDDTPGNALQTLINEMGDDPNWPDFADIQSLTLPDGRSLAGTAALPSSPLDGALSVIANEGSGHLGALIITPVGDTTAYEDLYLELLYSLHLGPERITAAETSTQTAGDNLIEQWASSATGTSEYSSTDWSFIQAAGAPDTKSCEDLVTAWASATATGSDILVLSYDQAVYPTQINIRQTLAPGSIVQVEVANSAASGQSILIPNSADPPGNTPCPGVFTLDITGVDTPIDTVFIYLDQTIGGTWNEIDAVQLIGTLTTTEPAATIPDKTTTVPTETPTEEAAAPVKGLATGQETTTEEVAADGSRFEVMLYEDGLFGIDTLPGWTVGTIDGIIEAASASEVGRYLDVIEPPSGEVFVQIIPPEVLKQTAMMPPEGEDLPTGVINRIYTWQNVEDPPQINAYVYGDTTGAIAALPAATLEPIIENLLFTYNAMTGGTAPEITNRSTPDGGDAMLIAFEKDGALFIAAAYGDLIAQEAQIGALLYSITLSDPESGASTAESTTVEPTAMPTEAPAEEVVEAPTTNGERFELALQDGGLFGIDTLPDWGIGTIDGIIEINSAPDSGSIPAEIIPVGGEVFIQIVPPEILTTLSIMPTEDADGAAGLLAQFIAWRRLEEQESTPYSYTDPPGAVVTIPAPTLEPAIAIMLLNYSLLADGDTPELSDRPTPESGDAALIAFEKDGALFLAAVYGDLAAQEDQVGALLDSITLQAE